MEAFDEVERAMLANLLGGRRPQLRVESSRVPRQQHGGAGRPAAARQSQQQQQPRQAPARAVAQQPAAPAADDLRARRILDIGRVIKQIDQRTTPEQRHAMATAWVTLDLSAPQVGAWLAAGIAPKDHELARDCVRHGLTPQDLKTRIDGVRAVDRLSEDGVASVAAQLHGATSTAA
jgi:hypothetical protein